VNVPAKVIEFAYDGLSRRIRKKVTEGTSTIAVWEAYVYDGWNMVLSVKLNPEVGASQGRPQSAIASYVWRPDLGSTPFARRNWQAAGGVRGLVMANYFTGANGGGIHLPVMDAMGNVTQVVRAGVQLNYNGDSMRSEFVYDYDAFGKETRSSTLVAGLNPDSFPFHYSTKFTDPESGFNYYGYRFYDPANGRWLNRDPIGEEGGLNLYGMVHNSTVNYWDLLGLKKTDAECCQQAIKEKDHKNKDGSLSQGFVICCEKRKVACVDTSQRPGFGNLDPEAQKILKECMLEHERSHFDDTVDCGDDPCYRPNGNKPLQHKDNEPNAYKVQRDCLKKAREACKTQACRDAVDDEADRSQHGMDWYDWHNKGQQGPAPKPPTPRIPPTPAPKVQ
jgi:RHS repeat-associated protein